MHATAIRTYSGRSFATALGVWFTLAAVVVAQSDSRPSTSYAARSQPLIAAPKPSATSPFAPPIDRDLRLPVAIKGFCVVSLRDRKQWLPGYERFQHMFDGKLYWFASQREQAIFAANPQRYVPALACDCAVTFVEQGIRVPGDPRYGTLHEQRLYFFRSDAEQAEFRADPTKYADADLAAEGLCLVSQVDEQREREGLAETTVIVKGMRYQFAGLHQQRTFLANMVRYGVEPHHALTMSPQQQQANSVPPHLLMPGSPSKSVATAPKQNATNKKLKKKLTKIENKAMSGYCAVTIREKGVWELGDPRFSVEFDDLTYLMVSEQEQSLFQQQPNKYVPALAGNCVVTEIDENRRVPGTIYHAALHEGEQRLFLFAGAAQKNKFNEDPDRYLKADVAAEGYCVVTLVDDRQRELGSTEFVTWHRGKRYFFASAEKQAKFAENIELYQE